MGILEVATLVSSATQPDEGSRTLETGLLLLMSSGFTGVIISIITSLVNRRKLKAESANIISEAAGGLVDRLSKENIRLTNDKNQALDRVADLELAARKKDQEIDSLQEQIDAHLEYDATLVAQLEALGQSVKPPPPIIIPR